MKMQRLQKPQSTVSCHQSSEPKPRVKAMAVSSAASTECQDAGLCTKDFVTLLAQLVVPKVFLEPLRVESLEEAQERLCSLSR